MSRVPVCPHMTVRDVAERLGVSTHTVLGWIARGELRAVNVATSPKCQRPTWRIAHEAVREFEDARSCSPTTPRRRASSSTRKEAGVVEFY